MARGRPKGSKAKKAAGDSIPVELAPSLQELAMRQPQELGMGSNPKPPTPALRFDADTVQRIKDCSEVYLVCKNGAQDKTVHRAEWLKEVV